MSVAGRPSGLLRILFFVCFLFSFFTPVFSERVYPWVTVSGTSFGWRDPEDNGLGAFGQRTDGFSTRGLSLPFKIFEKYFGPKWKSAANTRLQKCCSAVDIRTANGGLVRYRLVDRGPAESTNNGIDFTHGAAVEAGFVQLNERDFKRRVTYRFVRDPSFPGEEIFPQKLVMPNSAEDKKRQELYKKRGITVDGTTKPATPTTPTTQPPASPRPVFPARRLPPWLKPNTNKAAAAAAAAALAAKSRARLAKLKAQLDEIRQRRAREREVQPSPEIPEQPGDSSTRGNEPTIDISPVAPSVIPPAVEQLPSLSPQSPGQLPPPPSPSSVEPPIDPARESPIIAPTPNVSPMPPQSPLPIEPAGDPLDPHREALKQYLSELKDSATQPVISEPPSPELAAPEGTPQEALEENPVTDNSTVLLPEPAPSALPAPPESMESEFSLNEVRLKDSTPSEDSASEFSDHPDSFDFFFPE